MERRIKRYSVRGVSASHQSPLKVVPGTEPLAKPSLEHEHNADSEAVK